MSFLDDLNSAPENARREPRKHPDGWEPGALHTPNGGEITAQWDRKVPDWRALLVMWDFDPDQYEIVDDTVETRSWDAAIGNGEVRRMYYHRAKLRQKRTGAADIADLVKLVRSRRISTRVRRNGTDNPHALPAPVVDGAAYFLGLNDWQLGKRGTSATIARLTDAIDKSVARARKIRPTQIWLAALGDLGEACDGQYPMQTFEVELDRRDQGIIARRILLYAIDAHRAIAPIVMPTVAGNHGEHRKDGRAFTSFSDNDDVAWVEQVAEACALNPAVYGDVRFLIPREQLTLTVQPVPDGPIVGLAHGHQARRGGTTAQQKVESWWKGQAFGQRPVGDATILVTAHAHHFSIIENGPRTHIQAPTIDSGSQWFAETAGMDSKPGMLSFLITAKGWDDLKLL